MGSFEKLRRETEGRPEKKEKRGENRDEGEKDRRRVIRPLKPELATRDAPPPWYTVKPGQGNITTGLCHKKETVGPK